MNSSSTGIDLLEKNTVRLERILGTHIRAGIWTNRDRCCQKNRSIPEVSHLDAYMWTCRVRLVKEVTTLIRLIFVKIILIILTEILNLGKITCSPADKLNAI